MRKPLLPLWLFLVLSAPALGEELSQPPVLEEGQWVSLPGADSELLVIFTSQTTATPRGAAILIPDQGGHPDQPSVTGALRTALPKFGWNTLAIPAPPADKPGGLLDIGTRRLQAAVEYLQQQKAEKIVVIGHGLGATLGAAFLANQPDSPVAGLVAIGWYDPQGAEGKLTAIEAIAALSVPVLDLYGSLDFRAVEQGARARLLAARKANRTYRQKVVEGADHQHTGLGPALSQLVRGWLFATLVKGKSSP